MDTGKDSGRFDTIRVAVYCIMRMLFLLNNNSDGFAGGKLRSISPILLLDISLHP